MYLFYNLCFAGASVLFRLGYRIRVVGRENLPKDRGYVLCPNHLSAIDPVFVILARGWGRPMWVMAKEELFHNPFLSWFFRKIGAFPIERGKGDKTVLNNAIASVRAGRSMLIFPEGTRNRKGEGMLPLKSGAFVVAQSAGADIVPCRIIYRGGRQHLFCTVTVAFGEPIPLESLNLGGEHAASKLRAAKAVLTERIGKLYEENRQYW